MNSGDITFLQRPKFRQIKYGYSFKEKGPNVMSLLWRASYGNWANVAFWDENLTCEDQRR
jgi:hypothetical protein